MVARGRDLPPELLEMAARLAEQVDRDFSGAGAPMTGAQTAVNTFDERNTRPKRTYRK